MNISITVDAERAIVDTRRLANLSGLKLGLAAGAVHLAGKFKEYPPQSSRPQPFKTDKQRRAVMAMIRKGIIQIPYPRGTANTSEKLGQSWTTSSENGGFRQVVGTSASYAPLVQGNKQSPYHKVTGWQKVGDVAQAETPTLNRIIDSYVERDVRS